MGAVDWSEEGESTGDGRAGEAGAMEVLLYLTAREGQ